MRVLRLPILIFFLISLTGCGLFDTTIDVEVEAVPRAALVLPAPDLYTPEPTPWFIITEETAPDVFTDLKEKGYDPVLFGLTDKGYENIALNQAKILRLMTQFRAMIKASEEYYKEEENGK